MRKFLVLSSLFTLLLYPETFHSIQIDGENDFSPDEAVVIDDANDSYWSSQNELDTLFLTWNAETLFIGCSYTLNNNALLIFLDTETGGIDNANGLDWYPRDVRFSGAKPDFLVALWNCDLSLGGVRKLGENTSPVSYRGINSGSPGEKNFLEVAIPFELLGNPQKISLTALICGGDYAGAGDVMPDDPSVRGSGNAIINIFREITIDGDGDGVPDSLIAPVDVSKTEEYKVSFPEFKSVYIRPDIAQTGPVTIHVELTDTATLTVALFTEEGRFLKNVIEGVRTDFIEYSWDIHDLDKGIYILKFYTSENRGMLKKAFVRY